jgi:hypothetical protein
MNKSAVKQLYLIWIGGLLLLIALSLLLSSNLRAETVTQTDTVAVPSQSKVLGMIDLRPSYRQAGSFYMENAFELGYQFTPDVTASFLLAQNNNLLETKPGAGGFSPTIERSFARVRVNNIWQNKEQGLSLSYEQRLYVPVAAYDQEAGMIALSRNYFKLKKKFSDSFSLSFYEILVPSFYQRAGFVGATGPAAVAAFENRVYVMPAITFSSKLSLVFPIMFHQTRYRDFQAGARNNDSWRFFLWINPELTYAVNDNFSVGLGYYSDNLIKNDLSAITIGDGLKNGITQLAFTAEL